MLTVLPWGPTRGKTLGVVGYGDIGQSAARIARAFKMNIIALRRRDELSEQEQAEGLKVSPVQPLNVEIVTHQYLVVVPLLRGCFVPTWILFEQFWQAV